MKRYMYIHFYIGWCALFLRHKMHLFNFYYHWFVFSGSFFIWFIWITEIKKFEFLFSINFFSSFPLEMPPPLSSFTSILTTTAKPFAAKSIGPISTSVLRQQPYSSTVKKTPPVTESSVLSTFPRPNLQPTLYNLQLLKSINPIQTCFNCSGPHSTEYCPC